MLLQRRVCVVDIRRVVLVVMDLHRLGVDERVYRIERVGKRRKLKCHGGTLPWSEFVLLPRNQSKRYAFQNLNRSPAPARPRRAARFRLRRPSTATKAV